MATAIVLVFGALGLLSSPAATSRVAAASDGPPLIEPASAVHRYLPAVYRAPAPISTAPTSAPTSCPSLAAEAYAALALPDRPLHVAGEGDPDLDVAVRRWEPAPLAVAPGGGGLVDYPGPTDGRAPQLAGLAPAYITPGNVSFRGLYRVRDWDWVANQRGGPIAAWPVTLATIAVPAGGELQVPDSGYRIGEGFAVLVIYAATSRLTLKYTRDDDVVRGYTLHVTGACVEPRLLALYQRLDAAGRAQLPALKAGDAFGTASAAEVGIAIRDTGSFMDPRSRKDWWRGF
ncbi:MAG: hypothetical protein ABI780_07960 [Ardenticatenales bacterium]